MPAQITWRVSKPNDGLKAAMQLIAREVADEGEYSAVEILSTPKTTSGGRRAVPHFKVNLTGSDNGHNVIHSHLIKIEHRDKNGHTRRYQMNNRPANYDYTTLVAKNGLPNSCPKSKRVQREREAAEMAREAEEAAQSAQSQVMTASSSNSDASWSDGWYDDPWANESGKSLRWFENGFWTDYTE